MKRNNLTSAIVAGIAGVAGVANMAGAVNLNPDGLGQVLVYPYYTVNNNNNTLISVVNTHDEGKAVKVRFLEGYNSREVLDFNLYLSPYDVWVGTIFATGDGNAPAGLATDDNSCTVPGIKFNNSLPQIHPPEDTRRYAPFRNFAYSDVGNNPQNQNNDTGPEALSRTREGHIEIIEMAVITDETEGSLTALTHVDSVPADCNQLIGAWSQGGYWFNDPTIDTDVPTGGLFGAGSIVNAAEGIIMGYNADAVDHFRDNVNHAAPGTTDPKLSDAETDAINGIASAFVFDSNNAEAVQANGGLVRADYAVANGIDAVSAVFTADNLFNEYNVDTAAGASSEWVITFPTKRFYVDSAIVGVVVPPFVELFGENVDGKSCVQVGLLPFDREENPPGSCANGGVDPSNCIDFSPPIPGVDNRNVFCYEAQVVTFMTAADYTEAGGVSPVLGSRLTANVDLSAAYGDAFTGTGWMQIDLDPGIEPHALRPSTDLDVFHGLPVTGFLAQNFINNNVTQGVLANYSALYRHRFSRACTNVAQQGAACS